MRKLCKYNGKQTDWSDPDSPVTVNIPYTPAAEISALMTNLTRGDFLVMLMKAYDIAPDLAPDLAPGKEITRQEMFTLLYNALKVIKRLPHGDSGNKLSDFSDAGQISLWANEALTLLVETGMVSGDAGKLSPTDTTTRMEMEQVLYNLLGQ